ncbi:MAG: MerR family transcriptional regulator [Chloroflexi bacterium]|nr:MerR family transcriptional regulator [Chloroflexota bacterium]
MFKIGDFSRLTQVSIKALRYYDEIGLLKPAHIDRFTNYRYYTAEQLPRLNRILALKDLGLSLEQITDLIQTDLAPARLRDILQQKQAEIQRQLTEERARLARVEARLRQIEREGQAPAYDVVVKTVPAQRVAAIRAVVPTYADGGRLFGDLFGYLQACGIDPLSTTPWMSLYHDEGFRERDVDVTVTAPLDRIALALPDRDPVQVIDLPGAEIMLSVIYRGPYEDQAPAYAALLMHIQAHDYCVSGPNRQIYLQGPGPQLDPADYVTEIQFPVQIRDAG